VVEPGHHSRRLLLLTGIQAQENQARRLLHDIAGFRAQLANDQPLPDSIAAARWLAEIYEPTLRRLPSALDGKLDPVEAFHQILEHRWFLSEAKGGDVGLEPAVDSYVKDVLRAIESEEHEATRREPPPAPI